MDAEAVKKFFVTYYRIGSYTKNYEYTNVTLVSSSNQKLGGLSVNSLKSGKGKLYHDCTTNWKTWSYITEIPFTSYIFLHILSQGIMRGRNVKRIN